MSVQNIVMLNEVWKTILDEKQKMVDKVILSMERKRIFSEKCFKDILERPLDCPCKECSIQNVITYFTNNWNYFWIVLIQKWLLDSTCKRLENFCHVTEVRQFHRQLRQIQLILLKCNISATIVPKIWASNIHRFQQILCRMEGISKEWSIMVIKCGW